jgi:hypothetical protein
MQPVDALRPAQGTTGRTGAAGVCLADDLNAAAQFQIWFTSQAAAFSHAWASLFTFNRSVRVTART